MDINDWSSEFFQLFFIGITVVTATALSYTYVTTEGLSDAFFAIIGAGLLLAILVIAPVLLSDRGHGSD
jgi:amino acid permease